MGVLEEISGKFEQNLDLIRNCFREALTGLEARENHLNGVQGSLSESSRELALMLEAIEARAKEFEEKERECRLILEQGWKELDVKKNELSLIRDDIRVREEKLSEQEKLIGGLFERIELEGKHIGDLRCSVDEGFREICLKERQVADRWRELELVKKQIGSRENELDKKEEKLESLEKEIELREKVLGSKQGMLEARESELEAREKVLELQKELVMKQRELDSAQKSKECCSNKPGSINPTPSPERTKKRRKSEDKGASENESEQRALIDLVGSDSGDLGHSGSGCDLKESHSVLESDSAYSGSACDLGQAGLGLANSNSSPTYHSNKLFNNFRRAYTLSSFRVGQIWARSYHSSNDKIQKLYARILKVRDPIVHVAWLQPVAHYQRTMPYKRSKSVKLPATKQGWNEWIDTGLPVGCGGFICGKEEALSLSRCNFSYQVCYKETLTSWHLVSHYLIHPQEGETWALYKDWNTNCWASKPDNHLRCQYEIVEIVQRNSFDTKVAYLDKLEGYASLYHRRSHDKEDIFVIHDEEFFRFSHAVPSFRMSSYKREGVPEGSFELDPKSLPAVF
ncbi:uncharacterized protein LOC113759781 [Coffea eugenioides]|uniref:uncharacterized protein LOC113759781 n=1 Tax=Coffea eugenioides TaxID=49369 RepID=UPI000F611484|nr:uncharacterized protein LOC113759781 [Coffea eugenioides]XP_027158156.1 uncharacterized protein LOC113759781 [Coffea eugenioides]